MSETMTELSLTLDERHTADFEMIGNGGFAPLTGFQGSADWERVCAEMRTADGDYWPIPITLATDLECEVGDVVALSSDEGKPLGRITVEEIWERDAKSEAEQRLRHHRRGAPRASPRSTRRAAAASPARSRSTRCPTTRRPSCAATRRRRSTRPTSTARGWKRIVAFQTRNPIHRAHEYLTKAALETCDGLFIHPLIGKTKAGDIPADVRMRCYEVLMEKYYPNDRVVLGVKPAKMHYAGPREAVLHAIVRRNYGATHFIVGRDHAGAGDYYGTYDAQKIFDEIDIDELGIEPLMFEHTFWCNECEGLASGKTCPHDKEAHLFLSGTKVREMLGNGERPPHEFSRDEVADILIDAYKED